MASPASAPVGPDTPITIKITVQGVNKKLKLPLSELTPQVLPGKLRAFLTIHENQAVVFERFSDSSASYVNLDPSNVHAYKTLYRAAKAKLKLRLRATVGPSPSSPSAPAQVEPFEASYQGKLFLETVESLSKLKFGSETTLANAPGPSNDLASPASSGSAVETPSESAKAAPKPLQPAPVEYVPAVPACEYRSTLPEVPPKVPIDFTENKTPSNMPLLPPGHPPVSAQAPGQRRGCPYQRGYPAFVRTPRLPHPPRLPPGATYSWSVYCNVCDKAMLDEHYHCNVCDDGDYDICTGCHARGSHCKDASHWLIKRFLKDGKVLNSTTETFQAKTRSASQTDMPGAFTAAEEKKVEEELDVPTRTCNCCVKVFPEEEFVTCLDCPDYDLCIPCLEQSRHGHHPAHRFDPATEGTTLSAYAEGLCGAGRNVRHAALCDGCDASIVGVRHKCLVCPDWDYCSTCVKSASTIHPRHRFAAIYEPISGCTGYERVSTHIGVHCDGPLCIDKAGYIAGIRYKCAVCPDVDFCGSCEASPLFEHNRTHPLLKFRTPVRGCSITTLVGDQKTPVLDACGACNVNGSPSKPFLPPPPVVSSKIHTVADFKPSETASKSIKERIEIKDLLSEPIDETVRTRDLFSENAPTKAEAELQSTELQAYFIKDTVNDGATRLPGQRFVQTWTLRNPGPNVWPAGCSVRYVGGDNMLDVDDNHPSSAADISRATESNVTSHPILVGEECSFHVTMKAPKREGIAISYWRLKGPDNIPFGHRLWCHVSVISPTLPEASTARAGDVGRPGNHDAFLRLYLDHHTDRVRKMNEEAYAKFSKLKQLQAEAMNRIQANVEKRRSLIEKMEAQSSTVKTAERGFPLQIPKIATPVEMEAPVETPVVKEAEAETKIEAPVSKPIEVIEETVTEAASETTAAPEADDLDAFEDVESIIDSDLESESFLTDDEYDILDASDEEMA